MRIPGVCQNKRDTVVLAHLSTRLRYGGGLVAKAPDIFGAYACVDCHDVLDGRRDSIYSPQELKLYHWEAVGETIMILIEKKIVRVP